MNAEQKQRAKDLLQQYASYTNPRLLMLVDMAALLQELIDADEKSKYSVLAAPSVPDGKVGFSMYFDREQWGAIIDGLGFEIERSEQRKAANCESTSNVRADMCKEIILAINRVSDTAFTAQLLPEPPADLVRDAAPDIWRIMCGDWREETVAIHNSEGWIADGLDLKKAAALVKAHNGSLGLGIDAAIAAEKGGAAFRTMIEKGQS